MEASTWIPTISWSQVSFYNVVLTSVSQQFYFYRMTFRWKIFEWFVFHLPKDSKFINGGLIIITRRASPCWVAGCNSNWNIPPLGNTRVSLISNLSGCPMHWGELDSTAQNNSASVPWVGMWQMVPQSLSSLQGTVTHSEWQFHSRLFPLYRRLNEGSNLMPFVPALSTFILKGSYPHLVAQVPRQVAKAERRSQAALRCLPAPFPRAVPAADRRRPALPGGADPAGHRASRAAGARTSPARSAALTAPPAPARAAGAPSPCPGDGLMPGAGGILLPPAVTVSHTHECHTLCPGSPQLQGMRIAWRKKRMAITVRV